MAVRDRGTVPCTTTCWQENFIDTALVRLIDYEYSGNNDACFEHANVWSESNLSLDQLEQLSPGTDRRPLRKTRWRGRGCGG